MKGKERYMYDLFDKIKENNKSNYIETLEFHKLRKKIDGVKINTQYLDVLAIYHLSNFLKDKNFKEATKNDILDWDDTLTDSQGTRNLVKNKIKFFYTYLFNKDNFFEGKHERKKCIAPKPVAWIENQPNEDDIPLDSLLDEKDILKLLGSCGNIREQIVLLSLIDGGLRASELQKVKIKNVKFNDEIGRYYFLLPKKKKTKGKQEGLKTGSRKIQLFLIPSSTAIIREYLNHHRLKNNDDAPFILTANSRIYAPIFKRINGGIAVKEDTEKLFLSENGLYQIVERIGKRAGYPDIHPHLLRHQSATMCAKQGFNEPMMRERFGWSRNSKMPSKYIHLASEDLDEYIMQKLGIKKIKKKDSVLAPKICPNCNMENSPTNVFCGRCSVKLNATKKDLTTNATEVGLSTQDMLKDPEFRDFYNEMLLNTIEKYKEMKKN